MATHSSILAWDSCRLWGRTESDTTEATQQQQQQQSLNGSNILVKELILKYLPLQLTVASTKRDPPLPVKALRFQVDMGKMKGTVQKTLPLELASKRECCYCCFSCLSRFSRVRLCATPQTAAHQALRPWDSPGKNTGVSCHFLLQCMKMKSESEVAQLCPTLQDPMDCSPPGSSVHWIFQARVLEQGAIAFSEKRVRENKRRGGLENLVSI